MKRHRSGLALVLTFVIAGFVPARAAPPARAPIHHAQARLIGGTSTGGTLAAGLMIELDPGFKTYWRMPGESGLPPAFDWSGSQNVGEVVVGWPVPRRIEDSGGVAFGYEGRVVLPLTVRPLDPAAPVILALKLDYGVCHDICIPEHAELTRALATAAPTEEAAFVDAARQTVPRPQALGDAALPSIMSVDRVAPDRLAVTVRVDQPSTARLFVEAPEPWFLLASAEAISGAGNGAASGLSRFDVQILQRPEGEAGPVAVTLTLAVGDTGVETRVSLDGSLLAR